MSNENKPIQEFGVELICEYFSKMERQGPGSPEATISALSFIDGLSEQSRIADIGCGTGGQTTVLAKHTKGHILGIDLFPDFVDLFNKNIAKNNMQNRAKGIVGSMEDLPFKNEELDLIWSEGAIYNIGFERGLKEWRNFLKIGGFIAVSEISWLTEKRPQEIEQFWTSAYAEINTISNKIAQMNQAGYAFVAAFKLSEDCWIDHFYTPEAAIQEEFLVKYFGNSVVEDFIASQRQEADLYHRYKDYYSYVFYIGKKI